MSDDARFTHRTAVLGVTGRLLAVGGAAGMALGVLVMLIGAMGVSHPLGITGMNWGVALPGALVGLVAGTFANAVNAALAAVTLRFSSAAVARWVIVPIPVATALGNAMFLRHADSFVGAVVVSGVGALAVAIWLGPWCLRPSGAGSGSCDFAQDDGQRAG